MADKSVFGDRLLAVAAVIGLGAAVFSSFGIEDKRTPEGVLVQVGDTGVTAADLELAVTAFEQDSKFAVTDAERKAILGRLVDEALLVEHAIELDLPRTESMARKALVQAMVKLATADAPPPDDVALQAFYEANKARFTPPPLYRIALYSGDAATIGEAVTAIRAGASPEEAAAALRDASVAADWMTATNVATAAGPTVLETVAKLGVGDIAGPITRADGKAMVIWLMDRRDSKTPPYQFIRDQVAFEWRREADDKALDAYLADLRARYGVAE